MLNLNKMSFITPNFELSIHFHVIAVKTSGKIQGINIIDRVRRDNLFSCAMYRAINKPSKIDNKLPANNQIKLFFKTVIKSCSEKIVSKFLNPINPRFLPKKNFEKLNTNVS